MKDRIGRAWNELQARKTKGEMARAELATQYDTWHTLIEQKASEAGKRGLPERYARGHHFILSIGENNHLP